MAGTAHRACLLVGEIVFCGLCFAGRRIIRWSICACPFLIWAALRFGRREAATGYRFCLSSIAIWGTLHGFGPFAIGTKNESLLLLQSFMGIVAVMTLALAALAAERRRAEEQISKLSR